MNPHPQKRFIGEIYRTPTAGRFIGHPQNRKEDL
jgi:hypothetical protein